jgi:hypothetical protein
MMYCMMYYVFPIPGFYRWTVGLALTNSPAVKTRPLTPPILVLIYMLAHNHDSYIS